MRSSRAAAWPTGCRTANAAVGKTAAGKAELAGMGATLVAAQVRGDEVRWISVGDSPFFMVSAGSIERLNADHSMAPQIDALVKRGMLTADEAEHHPGRHTLREAVMGQPLSLDRQGQPHGSVPTSSCCCAATACRSLSEAEIAASAIKPARRR